MKESYKYGIGIGFWSGAGVYSLINMLLNLAHRPQNKILVYNYTITGAAVVGLIFNIIMAKKAKKNNF